MHYLGITIPEASNFEEGESEAKEKSDPTTQESGFHQSIFGTVQRG